MSHLAEAIRLIEHQISNREARCVIADEGYPDESSLLGTRDGYLNLALALLRFVANADNGACQSIAEGHWWADGIKSVMYQLPTQSTWIAGMSLFSDHKAFMAWLSQLVDPQIDYPLLNDPQFQESKNSGANGDLDA